jgi:hypothetical protein
MNKNYYIEELNKKVEGLEKRIRLLENCLLAELFGPRTDLKVGAKKIRPMTDKERQRSTERVEINQAWYDGDGGELFE